MFLELGAPDITFPKVHWIYFNYPSGKEPFQKIITAEKSDLLLPVKQSNYSVRLPIGARGDFKCTSLPCGEPQCATLFNSTSAKATLKESQNTFSTEKSLQYHSFKAKTF